MSYATEQIAEALKAARIRRGLSQRELSTKSGVPQGHISKIENGVVDLRLTSLVALARILDMELMLVPRKVVPAVNSILRTSERRIGENSGDTRVTIRELKNIQNKAAALSGIEIPKKDMQRIQQQIREMQKFQPAQVDLDSIRAASQAITEFQENFKNTDAFDKLRSQLQGVRNALANKTINIPEITLPLPAYSLDEDEND